MDSVISLTIAVQIVIQETGNQVYISRRSSRALGLVATDYIETGHYARAGILEDMPRLDYSGGASCPSLLLEPQRSNIIQYSEYIGAWTPSGLTISDNEATSPEGVSNAAKLTLPSGSATKRIARGSMPTTAVARSYSFFVKSDDITAVQLVHSGDLQGYARFDISTGVVGSTGTKTTSDIEDYGNGWYRCIANFDSTNAFGSTIYLYINDSATGSYGGSTSAAGDLFVYGGQYEEGSYPTSYIPTYGTSQTRSKDDCRKTGVSSLLNDSQGTLFAEFEIISNPTNESYPISIYGNGATIQIYYRSASQSISFLSSVSGIQYLYHSSVNPLGTHKVALVYQQGKYSAFIDGVLVNTQSSGNVPSEGTLSTLNFGDAGAGLFSGDAKQLLYFPMALTDSECIALTTL